MTPIGQKGDGGRGKIWRSSFPRFRTWLASKSIDAGSSCDGRVPRERTLAPSVFVRANWIYESPGPVLLCFLLDFLDIFTPVGLER